MAEAKVAERIFGVHFAEAVSRVTRFPTGMCHFVYEVLTESGKAYAVRIATPSTRPYVEGGLYWHAILKEAGVPVLSLVVDTEYVEFWLDAMQATKQQRATVHVYSLVFCLNFKEKWTESK